MAKPRLMEIEAEENFLVEFKDPNTLLEHPMNHKIHNDKQLEGIDYSIGKFKWLSCPIWNKRSNRILDGHGRRKVAIEKGLQSIPVRVVDVSDEEELEILAIFDQIGEMRGIDDKKLTQLLSSVAANIKKQPENDLSLEAFYSADQLKAVELFDLKAFLKEPPTDKIEPTGDGAEAPEDNSWQLSGKQETSDELVEFVVVMSESMKHKIFNKLKQIQRENSYETIAQALYVSLGF